MLSNASSDDFVGSCVLRQRAQLDVLWAGRFANLADSNAGFLRGTNGVWNSAAQYGARPVSGQRASCGGARLRPDRLSRSSRGGRSGAAIRSEGTGV